MYMHLLVLIFLSQIQKYLCRPSAGPVLMGIGQVGVD
jgi:hypothetical protein